MYRLIIRNAKQLIKICENGEQKLTGEQTKHVVICEDDEHGFSLVVNKQGNIEDIGKAEEIKLKYAGCQFDEDIDATGKCVLPGK